MKRYAPFYKLLNVRICGSVGGQKGKETASMQGPAM